MNLLLAETFAPVSAGVAAAARAKIDDPEALYQSLVRSLKRRKGFGIVFVQCTPAKGRELFSQLQKDLPKQQLGKLTLNEPIDNLLNVIAAREDIDHLKTLVIEGIEQSLLLYIQSEAGRNDYYKLEVLPPILDHLNRQRENFREVFRAFVLSIYSAALCPEVLVCIGQLISLIGVRAFGHLPLRKNSFCKRQSER